MSEDDQQWRSWVRRLAEGDEQIVAEFWRDYGQRLQNLAAKHIGAKLQRREGPDDVVQSVCRTFWRRARQGQFELTDSDSLWRLLCAITLTKVREKARFHTRQKRSCDQERRLAVSPEDSMPGVRHVSGGEPTPAEAAQFTDQLEQLLSGLDDEERRLVELKLQQFGHQEIADELGCSERTVRRILKRVQSRLEQMLDV